jgi:serine/threonine protein kinase
MRNIAHRDVKAENIIVNDDDGEIKVKLIDFGLACKFDPNKGMRRVAGTRTYLAPEMLQQKDPYSEKVDMWGIGILLYIMMTGYVPYHC